MRKEPTLQKPVKGGSLRKDGALPPSLDRYLKDTPPPKKPPSQ